MLIAIIYAFIITVFIGFMIENFKLSFYLRRVDFINIRMRNTILNILSGKKNFDIFIMNDLRKKINEEFLNTKLVDKYELYKVDDSKIKLKYFKGYVIEELEILAVEGGIELIEIDKRVLE
ncbi:hypothetical protein R9X47_23110 [Wukongibacter baidiensis]|uniref:hypothetical protein n=1 Tax=Wukongibacter baidiensis TaxID=1723361 RepID=UPI003D7F78EA